MKRTKLKLTLSIIFLSMILPMVLSGTMLPPLHEKPSLVTYTGDYYMHDSYEELVTDLLTLNSSFPGIVDLYSLNARYGHPLTVDGHDIWCIRITNEQAGFNKPEVLYIGCHHGNEIVTVETAFWFAQYLADNYEKDEQVTYLVNNREFYIIPCLNPDGRYASTPRRTNGNYYDLNRDYDFDAEEGNKGPFSEIETKCVRDLSEEHQFINSVSWHSGVHLIIYAWGTDLHEVPGPDYCPDNGAYYKQAALMSEVAGSYGEGTYDFGIANEELYSVHGGFEDYCYASRSEIGGIYTQDADGYLAGGQLGFCVEVTQKQAGTTESELGGTDKDGWVPKNNRIALVAADLAQPHVEWVSKPDIASISGKNETFTWTVMGSIEVNETFLEWSNTTDPGMFIPVTDNTLSGKSGWYDGEYSTSVVMPDDSGTYYFRVKAKVDSFANQSAMAGVDEIYSRFAKIRNWSNWSENVTSEGVYQELNGQLYWTSEITSINVVNLNPTTENTDTTSAVTTSSQETQFDSSSTTSATSTTSTVNNTAGFSYPFVLVQIALVVILRKKNSKS